MSGSRSERIRERLQQALAPAALEVRDDSHLHAGHAGARGGAGHYHVTLTSDRFIGRTRLQRHQLVYAALGDLMQTEIHALGIDARAPGEPG